MPSDRDTKSARELTEATGSDPETIAREYQPAAEIDSVSENSDE